MTSPATEEHDAVASDAVASGVAGVGAAWAPPAAESVVAADLPRSATDKTRLWVEPAKVGLIVAAGTAVIAAINPGDTGFVICLSKRLGIDCPICGGLRTVTSLAHGNIAAAFDHNVLLAVALPVITVIWAAWMVSALRQRRFVMPAVPRWLLTVGAVVVLAFTVARNLDGPAWVTYLASTTYH